MADRPARGIGRYKDLLWAALSGILIALGGAPLSLFICVFFAPALFARALGDGGASVPSVRRAAALGALTGFVANMIAMYWAVDLLRRFAHLPIPLALLVAALLWLSQAALFVVAALSSRFFIARGAAAWWVVPAALTLAGSVTPAIFPWRIGATQIEFLHFAQVADLGGVPLLDWLIATISCAAAAALRPAKKSKARERYLPSGVALLCLLLPLGYGLYRLPEVRRERAAAPLLRVGVVQPNVSIEDKRDRRKNFQQLSRMRVLTQGLESEGAQLCLWPESAYPYPMRRDAQHDRGGVLGLTRDGVHGPLLVGTLSMDGPRAYGRARNAEGRSIGVYRIGTGARFNSALGMAEGGAIVGFTDKVHLLSFGEYVPLRQWLRPLAERLFPQWQIPWGLSAGSGPQMLTLAGARIGVLNCYEDVLAGYVREQAAAGPQLWANLTNDAWFGQTSEPHLHHMVARMRAIETRRDLVRAVNTGVSAHTRATGVDAHQTGTFVEDSFIAETRLLSSTTFWVRWGDWVSPLCAGWLFLLWMWLRSGRNLHRRRFSMKRRVPPSGEKEMPEP